MKKQIILLFMCVSIVLTFSCDIKFINGINTATTEKDLNLTLTENETETEIEFEVAAEDETLEIKNEILIREDAEGLVKITIKDGKAEIEFDIDKWEALYNIYDYAAVQYDVTVLEKGPFPVLNYHYDVTIVDVCIGNIELSAYEFYTREFVCPTLVFLLADGTLEYAKANPVYA